MPIHPQPFPALPNDAVATYDWQDIASGQGYINLYPAETEDTKLLTKTTEIYPTYGKLYSDATNTAFDEDFDITFTVPLTVEGLVLITLPVYFAKGNTTDAITPTSTLTLYIRHWDGTTETTLASDSVVASMELGGAAYGKGAKVYSFSLDVSKTHFAAGSTLRYTITGTSTGNAAKFLWVYRDTANRTVAVTLPPGTTEMETSKTLIAIPINIDR